jgi:hypothetical protein
MKPTDDRLLSERDTILPSPEASLRNWHKQSTGNPDANPGCLTLPNHFFAIFGDVLPAFALKAAHRAFCAALIRAIPAALIVLFFRTGRGAALVDDDADFALMAAHRALAADLILAIEAALILRLPGLTDPPKLEAPVPPVIDSSWDCSFSICSLSVAAFLS